MKARWPRVPLGSVVRHRKEFVVIDDAMTYRRPRVQLHAKGVVLRDELPGALIKTKKQQVCRAGELLVAEIDAKVGGFGIVPSELDGAIVSSHYFLFVADTTRVDGRFLGHFIRTPAFRTQVEAQGSTNYAAIRPADVLRYEVPLPPLAEQRLVVEHVDVLAAMLREASTLRREAVEAADALVPSLHAQLAAGRTRRLGELLVLAEDPVPVAPERSYPQVGVRSFGCGLFAKAAVVGASTTYRAFNRLYDGAVVLSQVKGWEGAVAVCPASLDGWFVSPEYRTFRCVPSEARPGYLEALVRTPWFWRKLADATRGVGARRERTRPERFLEIEMPMPDVTRQAEAEAVFGKGGSVRQLQADTGAELDALLPAVLDRLFSGNR